MPTNRAVDWLRTPRGLKWAIPVALVAAPAYLFAMSVCATIVERGGPGYLNVWVLLFAWNAMKFAVLGVLTPVRWLTWLSRSRLRQVYRLSGGQPGLLLPSRTGEGTSSGPRLIGPGPA